MNARGVARRTGAVLLFALVLMMVFLTYSRAMSGSPGSSCLRRDDPDAASSLRRSSSSPFRSCCSFVRSPDGPIDDARNRLESEESEESALSRLPVVYASLRMFVEEPSFGFGYENFDRFDREFQRPVGNLVAPEKDHASHNLYLTIFVEQGVVGFALFCGPAVWWLVRTRSRWRYLPDARNDGPNARRRALVGDRRALHRQQLLEDAGAVRLRHLLADARSDRHARSAGPLRRRNAFRGPSDAGPVHHRHVSTRHHHVRRSRDPEPARPRCRGADPRRSATRSRRASSREQRLLQADVTYLAPFDWRLGGAEPGLLLVPASAALP